MLGNSNSQRRAAAKQDQNFSVESGHFTVDENWKIAFVGDSPFAKSRFSVDSLDMRDMLLPATAFLPSGSTVAERSDLRIAFLESLDDLLTDRRLPVSGYKFAASHFGVAAKIFEYGWLNGAFGIGDWTPSLFELMARDLIRGGWYGALKIEERCDAYLDSLTLDERRSLWNIRRYNRSLDVNLINDALAPIRSNAAHWHLLSARRHLATRCVQQIPELARILEKTPGRKGVGSRTVVGSAMRVANSFSRIRSGLRFLPFPAIGKQLNALSLPKVGRTKNLSPEDLAEILSTSYWWIVCVGPILIQLLDDLVADMRRFRGRPEILKKVIRESPYVAEIEGLIGQKITTAYAVHTPGGVSLRAVVQAYLCSAVALLATLNARRKGEIFHPIVGLRSSSMRTVDAELEIYSCEFYIEKTAREFIPFFVGPLTKRIFDNVLHVSKAAKVLADVPVERDDQGIFLQVSVSAFPDGQVSTLFTSTWNSSKGVKRHPFRLISSQQVLAHMFRRGHSLMYHYRFENGSLYSLSQQLGHRDLEMTRVYVTDVMTTPVDQTGAALWAPLSPSMRAAIQQEKELLKGELREVGEEKLISFVGKVLKGDNDTSGGYGRFVQRVYQHIVGRLEYRPNTFKGVADRISEALLARGHFPLPMEHGTCMAGGTKAQRLGRCFSAASGGLERRDASPTVCGRCPYHVVTEQHLKNIEADLEEAREIEASQAQSVRAERVRRTVAMLAEMVEHHRRRLRSAT